MKRCPICARAFPPEEIFCSVHGLPLVEERDPSGVVSGELTGLVLDERYRLGGVLGTGGMGVVYEAEHLRIGRRCAVKVLLPGLGSDPKLRMRFFQEVRATSRVRHPNVVEILDFGEHPRAGSYMVMEHLEGESLSRLVDRDAPLPLPLACSIGIQLCAALGATHAQGLLHRDLKPGNVIRLASGQVKVLDFGLVKPVEGDCCEGMPSLTTDGMVLGTPWYMSPEQFRGEHVDARADVYALGVILYEMLVGKPPFDGGTPIELMGKHLNEPVPAPREANPATTAPPSGEVILFKALSKSRATRYQSMAELADALYGLADEQGIELVDGGKRSLPSRPPPPPPGGPCGDERTERWASASPVEASTPPIEGLREFFAKRREETVDRAVAALVAAFPRYRSLDRSVVRSRVAKVVAAGIDVLGRDSSEMARGEPAVPQVDVGDSQLTLTEIVTALWLAYTTARAGLIEASGGDLSRYAALADRFDQRLLPFFFHVADAYVSFFQGRLQRANDALTRRNEELQQLRETMAGRVQQAAQQLAESERLKARVMESISSGMVLVERDTRRIQLWNAAMERLSGIPASQILGRSLAEVQHLVQGMPIEEFVDQIRYRQEVGLRKLRLSFGGKEQRTVYVSGQPFFDAKGDRAGTLFVLDDVTEREQVIESLGRFLSKDLVERIVARPGRLEPDGERRRAVVLAVEVRGLGAALDALPAEGVVTLLSRYVRAVARAIFHRGGTIERIAPEGLLAYFTRLGDSPAPALEAAVELAQRLDVLADRVRADGGGPVEVAMGIHAGDLMVLNVGGERFMVRTVVGEATRTAEALRAAAGPSEILVSPEVATLVDPGLVAPGPAVELPWRAARLAASRVLYMPAPDLDDDPDTLVG